MLLKDKLDFLLKLTMATNRQLAQEMNIDPSFVSRLRQGARGLPTNDQYVQAMASFFAKRCDSDYQRTGLAEALGMPELRIMNPTSSLTQIIYDWLTDRQSGPTHRVGKFLGDFSKFNVTALTTHNQYTKQSKSDTGVDNYVFYGNEGRRNAVRMQLDKMEGMSEPSTLLIVTDESYEWLLEDRSFSAELTERLVKLAESGFTIKRIAPNFNTADIAFDSLMRWLPIYMTGQAQTVYYPRLRDDLYRRTLLVAPGVAALVGTSVGHKTEAGLSFLTFSKSASLSFASEFEDYFAKCIPLTTAYSMRKDSKHLVACIERFDARRGACYRRTGALPTAFTPTNIIDEICYSDDYAVSAVAENLRLYTSQVERNMEQYRCVDLIRLHTAHEVARGKVPVPLATILTGRIRYYTVREYILHLEILLRHLKQYELYSVYFDENDEENGLCVKENNVALLIRRKEPFTIFEVTENNVVMACIDYMERLTETSLSAQAQKEQACARIADLIAQLYAVESSKRNKKN